MVSRSMGWWMRPWSTKKWSLEFFPEWFHVVGEVHVLVGSPEGEPHEGVSPRVFWNFKRTYEKENLTDINCFSFSFLHGKVGTYKNRRIFPGIMVQGSSPGGDPSKTHN